MLSLTLASGNSGQRPAWATLVADLETVQPDGQPISRQYVGFLNVLTVDERAVVGAKITNDEGAADLTDLAMNPAHPLVVQTHVGIGISTDDDRQIVYDDASLRSPDVEAGQFYFHRKWETTVCLESLAGRFVGVGKVPKSIGATQHVKARQIRSTVRHQRPIYGETGQRGPTLAPASVLRLPVPAIIGGQQGQENR